MLDFAVDNVEGLDETVRPFYEKGEDGKHYLKVNGAVAKTKLDEFRNTNIELMKKLEGFNGIDPDQYKELGRKVQTYEKALSGKKLEDIKDLVPKTQVDELVQERVQAMKTDYENKLGEVNGRLDVSTKQLETLVIDNSVRSAAMSHKVAPTAVDDVILRAKATFKLVDGQAVPHDSKGNVLYGVDGSTPLSVDQWVKGLRERAPHLFEGSSGGGAGGGYNSGGIDPGKMSPLQKIQSAMASK